MNMALTRDFKETVAARVHNDPAFAQALLDEAITLFLNGEPESAKLILRDLVNATVGFEALAEEVHKPAKSLHRMLSQSGNPTMSNISAVFAAIKRALKVRCTCKWSGHEFQIHVFQLVCLCGGGELAG
jgi:DNA-binding phage protein